MRYHVFSTTVIMSNDNQSDIAKPKITDNYAI
ncbi:hypothetical protein MEG_01659 [Bartonella tamiae Th307]|uniref:Uncharacterized protein n=1 Tax=Bartonella tamiae Th239 TaxID=1094558 RepID=J1K246_9HYPH|nr:hypothetical protein ME5_00222 [Bartonella tamiae Th239]EJF92489.1 hypothetical protein MEG_01659 [Bartonella tamiae Th307]